MIIWRLEKGEEGTNLALEFKITEQEISDIHKNKDPEIHQLCWNEWGIEVKVPEGRREQHWQYWPYPNNSALTNDGLSYPITL